MTTPIEAYKDIIKSFRQVHRFLKEHMKADKV